MRWPHFHRDPDWQVDGANRYRQCRCGARRVTRAYATIVGPSRRGWPSLVDRHGVPRNSSGWVPEPATGWVREEDMEPLRPPPGPAAGSFR